MIYFALSEQYHINMDNVLKILKKVSKKDVKPLAGSLRSTVSRDTLLPYCVICFGISVLYIFVKFPNECENSSNSILRQNKSKY